MRRGAEQADMYSLAFSPKAQLLVATSDRGTVHVFSLLHSQAQGQGSGGGALSLFGLMKGVLPKYFREERSLAFYRTGVHTHMLAAFGAEANTVIVVSSAGAYYKLQFDPQAGGEMKLLKEANFLATEEH
ncbi:unnamed protein product [Closterium sp. Naga37s-1]|nr:unnamed protein product [Closterium sp. Naga37s-1]